MSDQAGRPDPGDELVDVVDADDVVVAQVPRRRMRAERLRHRAAFVIVNTTDGRLLVHRRAGTKDLWPDRWDIGAGGVVGAGEAPGDAAARELAEELGVSDVDLVPVLVGAYCDADVDVVGYVWRAVTDGPFRMDDGEVVELRLVDRAAMERMLATETWVPDAVAMLSLEVLFPGQPADATTYHRHVQQLEFTVEPFVEGKLGPHVQAAIDAAAAMGAQVEIGPFGTTVLAEAAVMPEVVAAVTRAAFDHGATHVTLDLAAEGAR